MYRIKTISSTNYPQKEPAKGENRSLKHKKKEVYSQKKLISIASSHFHISNS